jgi:hypothetical protein
MRCIIAIIVQRKSFDAGYVRRLIQSEPETEREFVSYFGELMAIKLRTRLRAPEVKASERYLLGEMSEPERLDFEAHYFDCPACADDVRAGVALARGVKAVCAEDAALRQGTAALHRQRLVLRTANVCGNFGSVSVEDMAPGMKILHWVPQLNCTEKG